MSRREAVVYWAIVAVAIVAGLGLRWSVLRVGFHGDDSVQVAMLRGQFPADRSVFDLFRFADGVRDGGAVVDFGYHPWWSAEELRIAMFRPLSSALIALDNWWFGIDAAAHHAHSLVWWVVVILAIALLFAELLPLPVAVLAVVLFVIDDAQTAPVAWLANRSTLVCMAFGALGVWAHVRNRDRPGWQARVPEVLAFSVALLGGEYGLTLLGYVLAYEWLGRRGDPKERARAVVPAAAAVGVYLVLRFGFDFGVRQSGYYISFFSAPGAFAEAAVSRVPALMGELVAGIPAAWWALGTPWAEWRPEWREITEWRRSQFWLGLAAATFFLWVARRLEPDDEERPSTPWWLAVGAVLTTLPVAGALPEDRLLVAASIGLSAVAAAVVVRAIPRRGDGRRWSTRLGLIGLGGLVLYHHVWVTLERSRDYVNRIVVGVAAQREWAFNAEIPKDPSKLRIVIVSAADFTTNANLPFVRALRGDPLPRSYWRLSGSTHVHQLERKAPNVLEVATLSADIDDSMAGSLYRASASPLRVGDRVELEGMTVEIMMVAGSNPWRTRVTFDEPPDGPGFLFLHSTAEGLRRIPVPPVGDKLRLPRPQFPTL